MAITKDMSVYEVVSNHPETKEIFISNGFSKITDPVKLKTVARFVTLEAACIMKNVDADEFVASLNKHTGEDL